jgi:hypothetical protein
MPSEIWVGDLARALAALPPGRDTAADTVARLLGFARPSAETAPATPAGQADGDAPAGFASAGQEPGAGGGAQEDGTPKSPEPPRSDLPLLKPVARQAVEGTGWGTESLPPPEIETVGTVHERIPLLEPRSAAATFQTMIARKFPDGPLDVPAVVEMLARRQLPDRLPRQAWPTLRFGIEVLVDLGLPMRLFAGDQAQVVQQVRAIAGDQLTNVRYFSDVPARGAGTGPRWTWEEYEPPGPGTRVLVLSDFGLGAPLWYAHRGDADEWRSFTHLLRRQGCDAVALAPVPAGRWPGWLTALMPLICWDRTTTVSTVIAALRGR